MSTPDVSHLSTQPAPAPLHVHRIGLSSTPPPTASSTPPAPIPPATLTAQAGLLTTTTTNHQPSLWEDPPQETGSGGSAPGIPPLNAKETVEPPTPGSRSETDGTPLSPLTRTAADTSGSTASNLTPDVGPQQITHDLVNPNHPCRFTLAPRLLPAVH
ncbi:hypothetical protein PtA15_18A443 [Puccinia triticina]|uniref:Uncharacterized protein n=1 Tax=Puccinia triticina TaxID=208348 RepID=A0ABY7D4K0_9BASI|nr:uncharacterized protein PtA15_15A207 [Puccinia triticina]XP_053028937.1 uncharacterized protein PtA15_18A443 [Puccinia triticina]WAQ91815.1 hypothetical protein PtA15_15A207 [Puccinia triticina]WAQ93382.1 hypothetical protein PtA15_18A443 [Puccinia triticina]